MTHPNNGGFMDTGYPALISDPPVTSPDLPAQKTSCGLGPDENPATSPSSEPTGPPPTIATPS